MDTMLYLILGYCLIREVMFYYTTHRLINKLMSRNYHEFQMAEEVGKLNTAYQPPKMDEEIAEDLRILSGIG